MRIKFKSILVLLSTLLIITLTSCEFSLLQEGGNTDYPAVRTSEDYDVPKPDKKGDYTITFVCNNGYTYQSVSTSENKVLKPDNPVKKYASFIGWSTNLDYSELFNFNTVINHNMVLYAKYSIDYVSLFNDVSSNLTLTNITVSVENKDRIGLASNTLGSGVIIYESAYYYYALTNHHVVYTTAPYQIIKVYDAFQNVSIASVECMDVSYDLALLKFEKSGKAKTCTIAEYSVFQNELVFAIGQPEGLTNTVTSGYILGKRKNVPSEETKEKSYVTFDIYYSNAPIDNGSSGGALFDSNLNLIGINFASSYTEDNVFVSSESIPSSEIIEFLKKYTKLY